MTLNDWLLVLKESVPILLTITALIIGFKAWKRQYIGRRKIELAEEVLALFYEASDIIEYMRLRLAYVDEGSTRQPTKGETAEQKKLFDDAFIVYERHNKRTDIFNKLRSLKYRCIIQLGAAASEPFDDLKKILNDIFMAANMLAQLWTQSKIKNDKYYEDIKTYEAIFWEGLREDDPIRPRVGSMIEKIEKVCKPLIKN